MQIIADVIKTLDKWKNLKMSNDMTVSAFIQYVYNLLNNLKEINKLSSNIIVVYKVLKNLPMKFKTFVRMLQTEIITLTLPNLVS